MPLAAAIPFFFLIGVSIGCVAYYAVVAFRIVRAVRRLPTLAKAIPIAEEIPFWPSLCVVVPAHDEQDVIAGLVRSLKRQDYPNLRVVLALDRCSDRTEEIARREFDRDSTDGGVRFEIVTIEDCPDDWAGKVHAAHCGVTRSASAQDAELLLFTDADTWCGPSALRCAVALLTNRHLDLLSLLPSLTIGHWFERVVQPAAGFELIRRYPLDRLNRDGRIRFANGQFMLFKRDAYDTIGGHERVRHALLEDLAFAKLITHKDHPRRLGVLLAGDLFRCRMYADWPEFRRGWKRIYTESSHRVVGRLRRDAWRVRLLGAGLPACALLTLVAGPLVWMGVGDQPLGLALTAAGALALLVYAVAIGLVLRTQGLPAHLVATYPIGAWLTGSILHEARSDLLAGRKTSWGGREYTREAR